MVVKKTAISQELSPSEKNFQAAIEIFRRAFAEDRERLTPREIRDLDALMRWDSKTVLSEFRRFRARQRALMVAGSPEDRLAAEEALADSRRILEQRGEDIRGQITALEKELRRLELDVSIREKRLAEMREGVVTARANLPKDYLKEHAREIGALKESLVPRINELATQCNQARAFMALNVNDAKAVSMLGSEYRSIDSKSGRVAVNEHFIKERARLSAGLSSWEQELRERVAELSRMISEANAKLDFVVRDGV